MALMVPDAIRETTKSSGERALFRRFPKELPDNCIVLHSLGLVNHHEKIWAECDFVVLSTQGIFVLEVKSGGVSCSNGKWTYTRSDGAESVKLEGPFEQAQGAMRAVKEVIEAGAVKKGLLIGYGVIMPDENFTTEGPEIELGVLLRAPDFKVNLGDYIFHLSRFWHEKYQKKHGRSPRYPSRSEIEAMSHALRPEIHTALTLDSFLTNLDQQMVELTGEQIRIMKCLDSNRRTTVAGRAGTGKTILAADKAVRLVQQGKRVLYLCFNRLLGLHVRESVQKNYGDLGGNLQVSSIHAWICDVLCKAGVPRPVIQGNEEDFVDEYVDAYIEAIEKLQSEPFDAIIIDEGQDLMRRAFFDAFDLSLIGGLARGEWHIFYDPMQNIYQGEIQSVLDDLAKIGSAGFSLTVNCRNTAEVAMLSSIVSGIDVALERAVEGGNASVQYYSTAEDLVAQLDTCIRNLIRKGVKRKDIIILSRFKHENSSLAGVEKIADLWVSDISNPVDNKKTLDFCTIHSFKGLERRIVLAIDLHHLLEERSKYLHYCGLSRARSNLVVFLNRRDKDDFDRLSYEFGARAQEMAAGSGF